MANFRCGHIGATNVLGRLNIFLNCIVHLLQRPVVLVGDTSYNSVLMRQRLCERYDRAVSDRPDCDSGCARFQKPIAMLSITLINIQNIPVRLWKSDATVRREGEANVRGCAQENKGAHGVGGMGVRDAASTPQQTPVSRRVECRWVREREALGTK